MGIVTHNIYFGNRDLPTEFKFNKNTPFIFKFNKNTPTMEITRYNSDSGNRDLPTEFKFNNNIPFIEILQKAIELKALLIVKTSHVNDARPGAWYIKGCNCPFTHDEIKSRILDNVKNNKHAKRQCYLLTYQR